MESSDLYSILGVSPGSSNEEIRRAYKRAALSHHPDKNLADESATNRFHLLTEAANVLCDEDKRKQYDIRQRQSYLSSALQAATDAAEIASEFSFPKKRTTFSESNTTTENSIIASAAAANSKRKKKDAAKIKNMGKSRNKKAKESSRSSSGSSNLSVRRSYEADKSLASTSSQVYSFKNSSKSEVAPRNQDSNESMQDMASNEKSSTDDSNNNSTTGSSNGNNRASSSSGGDGSGGSKSTQTASSTGLTMNMMSMTNNSNSNTTTSSSSNNSNNNSNSNSNNNSNDGEDTDDVDVDDNEKRSRKKSNNNNNNNSGSSDGSTGNSGNGGNSNGGGGNNSKSKGGRKKRGDEEDDFSEMITMKGGSSDSASSSSSEGATAATNTTSNTSNTNNTTTSSGEASGNVDGDDSKRVSFASERRAATLSYVNNRDNPSLQALFADMCSGPSSDQWRGGYKRIRGNQVTTLVQQLLPVTLEEIFTGCTKRFRITRTFVDEITTQRWSIQQTIEVYIAPGSPTGTKFRFDDQGNILSPEEAMRCSLVLILSEKPHIRFRREGDDLVTTISITLKQALCGVATSIIALDGRAVPVITDRNLVISPETVFTVLGAGMPSPLRPLGEYGNLLVKFKIDFPSTVTEEQRHIFESSL